MIRKNLELLLLLLLLLVGCSEDKKDIKSTEESLNFNNLESNTSQDVNNTPLVNTEVNQQDSENNTSQDVNNPPIANAGKNQNMKANSTIILDASMSSDIDGHIVKYSWSKNGKKISSKKIYKINNLSIGIHTFVLEVTDNNGVTSNDKVVVTIREYKNFIINFDYDKIGTSCNNNRYCSVNLYKVKVENNKWRTTTRLKSPYTAKEDEMLYIGFSKATLLDVNHNIREEDIIENTLSLDPVKRGTSQYIVFKVSEKINFHMNITHEISKRINSFCFDSSPFSTLSKDYNILYKLDEDLDKEYIIKNVSNYYFSYDTSSHKYNDNLLIECHNKNGYLYSAIVHLKNDEFWNFKDFTSVNRNHHGFFKVDRLTDIYSYGYRFFRASGIEHGIAKKRSTEKVKSIFKDYKSKNIGEAEYSYNGTTYSIKNSISKALDNQFDFIKYFYEKNNQYFNAREVLNAISSHLFNNDYIDDYLKVNFFEDEIKVLSKNNLFNSFDNWKSEGTIENAYSNGRIFIDSQNILNISLVSNRKNDDALSLFKVHQTVNIRNLDKLNLYFRASIKEINGLEEKNVIGINDCTGMAGITLNYIDINNKSIGYTSIINMDESIIFGTFFYGNAQTVESTNYRHIIKTNSMNEFRAIVLNIKDEIKNIPDIKNINEVDKIQMILFTSDYYTQGVRYYWNHKMTSDCRDAKAFLKVKEAGIYTVK